MSKRDWKLFIIDILESIGKIGDYIRDCSLEEFLSDSKTKDAVIRNLEIIGEAANQIPKHIQQKYEGIPWAQIIGMRNRLAHGYFVVDYEIVWNIVKKELPELKEKIKKS
ncbi:MAG: DUF86 domain-containing protein [Thermodesulforhabdaceae bacterium]